MTKQSFEQYNSKRNLSDKSFVSACYAPFLTLDFFTTGAVQVCCESFTFPVGNIQTDSLINIWKGAKIQVLRNALKNYDFSHGCQGCEKTIRRGGRPFAANYDGHPIGSTYEWPKIMQFRLTNACNFACVMCDGNHSSIIRRDREKQPPMAHVYHEPFFENLVPFLPHLRNIVFAGGEPFLIRENFKIWDRLIQTQTDATCNIITNGSIWNEKVCYYLERLNINEFSISIDGTTKKTFESVRIGSNFDTVMENIKCFAVAIKQVRPRGLFGKRAGLLTFSYCLMPNNFHELPDVFLMAEDWEAEVFVNVVTFPQPHSFLYRPRHELESALSLLKNRHEKIGQRLSSVNQRRYLEALSTLSGMAHEVES